MINSDTRFVCRNINDFQPVNFSEFRRFGHCRSRHARQFRIQAEIILERNRSQRLVFRLNFNVFFGFQSLMQTVGITSAFHHAAGKFVNDDNLAVADNVIDVALKKFMRFQRLIDIMNDRRVNRVVHRAAKQSRFLQQFFHMQSSRFGQGYRALFFVLFIIFRF